MKALKATKEEHVGTRIKKKKQFNSDLNRQEIYTYSMRGHLAVFAEILSSNQLLWDSFSSLEKYSKALEHTI